jgi:hypothetical protein
MPGIPPLADNSPAEAAADATAQIALARDPSEQDEEEIAPNSNRSGDNMQDRPRDA